jgi:hypothetical protein
MNFFPLLSSIISAVFAFLLAVQYLQRRKKHQLIWTISLVMFFLATFLEFFAEYTYQISPSGTGWNELTYKLYYVLTPVMVALMGTGALYLLTHLPVGKYFLSYTIILTVPFFVLSFAFPLGDALQKAVVEAGSTEIGGAAMPSNVRIFSPLFTIPGGLAIIGGALYSFWLDKTRKYNLLIALGGLFPFLGGLKTRFGDPTYFYLLETIGTVLLFAGFVLSWEYTRSRKTGKIETSQKIV